LTTHEVFTVHPFAINVTIAAALPEVGATFVPPKLMVPTAPLVVPLALAARSLRSWSTIEASRPLFEKSINVIDVDVQYCKP